MRGVASREMSRLQDLMEEASARTPEGAPSLNLQDFKVLGAGRKEGESELELFKTLRPFFVAEDGAQRVEERRSIPRSRRCHEELQFVEGRDAVYACFMQDNPAATDELGPQYLPSWTSEATTLSGEMMISFLCAQLL